MRWKSCAANDRDLEDDLEEIEDIDNEKSYVNSGPSKSKTVLRRGSKMVKNGAIKAKMNKLVGLMGKLLQVTKRSPKQRYIAERCRKAAGRKVESAIGMIVGG